MRAIRLTSCEANAGQVADEQGKADSNRSDECGTMLLGSEHEDGEHQECSQEHLNKESLGEICAFRQRRRHGELL